MISSVFVYKCREPQGTLALKATKSKFVQAWGAQMLFASVFLHKFGL